ncbi:hypothetical protein K435DRAFT_941538 [Dendrothele bispora CBS 962.96]|uniref:RRM domain-containing protein n=1 Tax=Dendrothele bispora (strain CBS 962.96) TaxID=1314807 RepID=A0A4S8KW17_DENBC|nr:hypothetical protein K435DRAFT_941538 [Dendrothele bispora CBS 962.96]
MSMNRHHPYESMPRGSSRSSEDYNFTARLTSISTQAQESSRFSRSRNTVDSNGHAISPNSSGRRSASPTRGLGRDRERNSRGGPGLGLSKYEYEPGEWQPDDSPGRSVGVTSTRGRDWDSRDGRDGGRDWNRNSNHEKDISRQDAGGSSLNVVPYLSLSIYPTLHDPRRTLMVRNIPLKANPETVRAHFQAHGRVEHFEDFIRSNGILFVTFYDIRSAERACAKLDWFEMLFQKLEVSFFRPRDSSVLLRGALLVKSSSINDTYLHISMKRFGDVKSIRPAGNGFTDSFHVDFYDIRDCLDAFDHFRTNVQIPAHETGSIIACELAWNTSRSAFKSDEGTKVPIDVEKLLAGSNHNLQAGERPVYESNPEQRMKDAIKTQQLLAAFAAASRSGAFNKTPSSKPVAPPVVAPPVVTPTIDNDPSSSKPPPSLPLLAPAVLSTSPQLETLATNHQVNSYPNFLGHVSSVKHGPASNSNYITAPPASSNIEGANLGTPISSSQDTSAKVQELLSLLERENVRKVRETCVANLSRRVQQEAQVQNQAQHQVQERRTFTPPNAASMMAGPGPGLGLELMGLIASNIANSNGSATLGDSTMAVHRGHSTNLRVPTTMITAPLGAYVPKPSDPRLKKP